MHVEVLICTLNERISQAAKVLAEPADGVSYLISWQCTTAASLPLPAAIAQRTDVKVTKTQAQGLSANRNNALQHATGDILVIADDDMTYTQDAFTQMATIFATHRNVDIACFRVGKATGGFIKSYPDTSFAYPQVPRGMYFNSCELVLRGHCKSLTFDHRFGLGSPVLACGEEEVFVHDAYHKANKHIVYFPITIAVLNDAMTTGTRFYTDRKVRMSKGSVLCHMHGYWGAVLRCLKFACLQGIGQRRNPLALFCDMYKGIRYICQTSR